MLQRVLFIINPAAGGGRGHQRWAKFENEMHAGGFVADKLFTKAAGGAQKIAASNCRDYDIVAAVGGDGTVCEVANGILASPAPNTCLGIVPCGTGNDIARTLGLRNLTDAAKALTVFRSERVDVIRINCMAHNQPHKRHALLFAGAGVIGPVLRRATSLSKRVLGRGLTYKIGLLHALWGYQSPRLAIQCDGRRFEDQFLFLGVSNGEDAGGGMKLAPGARINDGILNVNLVGHIGYLEGLRQINRLCKGQHTDHPKVRYFEAKSIALQSEEAVEIAADGELIGHTPARFEINPGALSVITNR
jgi:YegS/Rv2252/BmrU family lipid kinase